MIGILTKYHVSKNISAKESFTNTTTDSRDFLKLRLRYSRDGTSLKTYTIGDISSSNKVILPFEVSSNNDEVTLFHSGASRNINIMSINGGLPKGQYTISFNVIGWDCTTIGGVEIEKIMLNTGDTALPFEPIGNTWNDIPYSKLETATDAVTNLPVEILTDGQPVTSWTMKGNTTTSGTPSPSNPVTVDGVGNETANLSNIYEISKSDSILYITLNLPQSLPIGQYTFSANMTPDEGVTESRVSFRDSSGNSVGNMRIYYSSTGRSTGTVTISGEATKLYIYGAYSTSVYAAISYTDIMLNEGDEALTFEPHGYKISILKDSSPLTPMYFSQPLYKIDTYADDVNSSGTATYKITMQRITQISLSNNFSRAFTVDVPVPAAIQTIYSNIAVSTSSLPDTADRDGKVFINSSKTFIGFGASEDFPIAGSGNPTQAERDVFQAYLQNNEVYVWYVLATATTESVTVPSIPTTGGTATIDVDTTVKPSELDLTYHGWHEHQPLKRENGAWE